MSDNKALPVTPPRSGGRVHKVSEDELDFQGSGTRFVEAVSKGESKTLRTQLGRFSSTIKYSIFSAQCIRGLQDRRAGISFALPASTPLYGIGLTSGSSQHKDTLENNNSRASLNYAVVSDANGYAVYESGLLRIKLGPKLAGDRIEIVVNSARRVEYRLNGEPKFESLHPPEYPLHVKMFGVPLGGGTEVISELSWVFSDHTFTCEMEGMCCALASAQRHNMALKRKLEEEVVKTAIVRKVAEVALRTPEVSCRTPQKRSRPLAGVLTW